MTNDPRELAKNRSKSSKVLFIVFLVTSITHSSPIHETHQSPIDPKHSISPTTASSDDCSKHCINCDSGFCKKCDLGYYTQKLGGKCLKCNNSCSVCSSQDHCTVCADGYKDSSSKSTPKNMLR